MNLSLVCCLWLAVPACSGTETMQISKKFAGKPAAALTIRFVDSDGNPAREIRFDMDRGGGPGPWFGSEAPSPDRASRNEATWNWDRLKPGTYDIRFSIADAFWIISTRVAPGDQKEFLLRMPATHFVKGRLENVSGPVRGATISALSRSRGTEDRIFWKSWTKTGDAGEYRLPLLSPVEGIVEAQVFLDDENPKSLDLEGEGGAARFVFSNNFRGEEIWSHTLKSNDAREFDAGSTRLRSCHSSIELVGENLPDMKAWIFVKSRPDFDYRFQTRPHRAERIWRTFRTFDSFPSSLRIPGLPEGEVLLVIGPGPKEKNAHHFGFHRLLRLLPGKTEKVILTAPGQAGNLEINLDGFEVGSEEDFARIKRSIVLLPKELLEESGLELAEAFHYSMPWKAEEISIHQIPQGSYVAWMEGFPWFDTTLPSPDHAKALPLDLLLRALRRKIAGEKITPDHAEFHMNPTDTRRIRFTFQVTR